MKQAIIVVTCSKSYNTFLKDLLDSIVGKTKYPIIIHMATPDNNYEMSGIKLGVNLEIDEFFLLCDSIVIKDPRIFDIAFEEHKGKTVYLGSKFLSYVGKYRLDILKSMKLPTPMTRLDSCVQEFSFNGRYLDIEQNKIELDPNFWKDTNTFEFRHGRNNMINQNEYLIKYKGHWTSTMLEDD